MNMTKEQLTDVAEVIRHLQRELNYAYQGLRTLPEDHSARVAYAEADTLLASWST